MNTNHCRDTKFFTLLSILAFATVLSLPTRAAEQTEPPLSQTEQSIVSWVTSRQDAMVDLLRTITNINSGSLNKSGLDTLRELFADELRSLNFATTSLPGGQIEMPHCPGSDLSMDLADHLLATRSGVGTRVLLMGHMDTVFTPDSPFQEFSIADGVMRGPGVYDMKGGLVAMLFALQALDEFGLLANHNLSVLLNSDEEVGSLSSRTYLEQQALLHDYGLVFEGSAQNNMVRQRKGLGQARLVVHGRASHAGSAHQDGRSAIRELAYKIIEMESMTDYESGLTVNVGMVNGGEARNMVSPCAEAYVDLRYPQPQQGIAAQQQFEAIANAQYSIPEQSDELRSEIWVNLHRPPKIPTPESDRLLQRTVAIGSLLGEQIGVADSGGGTDGSLTQAVGLPTLDSLGVIGSGGHSQREQADLDSLVQVTTRFAVLLHRLLQEQ